MPAPTPPSLASGIDPEILAALEQASSKEDVRLILSRYDTDAVHRAWKGLPLVQQAALRLVHFTNGRIFHELNDTD